MNAYLYDELRIGMAENFSVTITNEMQNMFLKISGDLNPMHSDNEYASEKGYDSPLVYGMLTAAFYSTLVGTYLPGKYCLFQEADIQFSKPVFVGDSLEINGEITEINDLYKRLTIKARIKNQNDMIVSRAKLKVGVLS